jgi:hypothetical protein
VRTDVWQFFIIGFDDFPKELSRPDNDAFYKAQGISLQHVGTSWDDLCEPLQDQLDDFLSSHHPEQQVEIHVDYSSMPRRWYCVLPELIEESLRPGDRAFFWYTPGKYPVTKYPTAGTSDFRVFSGRPSLSSQSRTHVFGLGFDRTRSQAIWSVLDPRNLICFYADPAAEEAYVERVRADNGEVLDAASYTFTVPLDDFATTFSKVTSVVSQFRNIGDVIIVPDGPKPLILASSLIPRYMEDPSGVVCFHVARRKTDDFTPVDVARNGPAVGFSFGALSNVGQ